MNKSNNAETGGSGIMVIRIIIRNVGESYFRYSFKVFNIKIGEPFNLNKILFSSKEYLYEKDMEEELRNHPELKKNSRAYAIFGIPPSYLPTGIIEFYP
jgi:predicted ATP-grasp superfamily ATP-dependent carboligase